MNIECFMDGICPKCGGHAYGYSLSEPMVCSKCGFVIEMLNSDIELAMKMIQGLRKEEEEC